jgi:hypothetical protein
VSAGLADVEEEELVRPGDRNGPATSRADRDRVSGLQLLKARNKRVGAGVVEDPEQLVEPVVAVKASASIPHLCEPGPDVSGQCVDRDSASADLLRGLDETVAGQGSRDFAWRCTPVNVPGTYHQPVDQSEHEENRQCRDSAS